MAARTTSFRALRIVFIGMVTVVFLLSTTPAELPSFLLIAPFVGMFSFLYASILETMRLLGPDEDENGAIVQVRRPRLLSAVVAGFPVLLLVIQSVVELTLWDVLIALLIMILAYVYVSRGSVTFRR